jgi:molybdopterin converting factor small subunit
MPDIWIPAQLRGMTNGQERVMVTGKTLRQAVDELEAHHPGLKARLVQDDQLRPEYSVVVDGIVSQMRLRHPLSENSEVHILPAISGG